ncbi:MAG TPA: acyltransferase, partial [Ktedonobacteraceae bacterium]
DATHYIAFLQRLVGRITIALEGKQQKGTIPVLDGIRALACLAVVAYHISLMTIQDTPLWTPQHTPTLIAAIALSGDTGVTLFFVLSGFLLFRPYVKALLFPDTDWPSTWRFYLRRALRILPVYYISLIALAIILAPNYFNLDHARQWLLFLTLFMDSSARTYQQINGPFWTLAVEWQFYLLLPFIALGMALLVNRFKSFQHRLFALLTCLGLLIVWGIGTRTLGLYMTSHPNGIFLPRAILTKIMPFIYGPLSSTGLHGKFMEDFAIGMLASTCYTLSLYQQGESKFQMTLNKLAPLFFAAGVLLLLTMALWKLNNAFQLVPVFDPVNGLYSNLSEFGFASGYGLCIVAALFGASWLKGPFEWRPLRWIGILSYSIYMWHLPVLKIFSDHFIAPLQGIEPKPILYGMYWACLLVLVIPLCFVIFLSIEKPGMALIKYLPFANKNGRAIPEVVSPPVANKNGRAIPEVVSPPERLG